MEDKSWEITIDAADDWSIAAGRDLKAFKALVRCKFFPLISCMPKEPQMAVYHLQQATEKMVKAIAIASGKFTFEELRKKYGHDSLSLYADVIEKLIEIPATKALIDTIEGKLKKESEVKIISQVEALNTLEKIKDNVRKKGKEIPDWYYELALLPEEPMKSSLNSMIKTHNKIRVLRFFLRLIPAGLFAIKRDKVRESMGIASSFLSKKGHLVNERIEKYFNNEAVKLYLNQGDNVGKIRIIEILREAIMPSYALSELLMLSAFTFTHSIGPKYPGNRLDKNVAKDILVDRLYDGTIGIVRCLKKVGKMTELVYKEIDEVTLYIMGIFDYFNSIGNIKENDESPD